MITFDLSPSPEDRSVSFDVPKDIDPYLVNFFNETKQDGDTVTEFLLRRLLKDAYEYHANKQILVEHTEMQTNTQKILSDLKTVIADL